jgi:putative redox protein
VIHTRSLEGAYKTAVSNGRQELVSDAPLGKGGHGAGFGAHELLEAALAACINMAVRMCADAQAIPLESVTTRVRVQHRAPDTLCFEYSLGFSGPLTAQQRDRLEVAASACPVRQTLSKRIEFEDVSGSS